MGTLHYLNKGDQGAKAMPSYRIPRRPFSPESGERTAINWRRGMIRIWILVSTAWIMGWIIYFTIEGIESGFRLTGKALSVPVVLFGPPIALLVFGFAARWAFHGFSVDEQPPAASSSGD
jgi:hypothetical protein